MVDFVIDGNNVGKHPCSMSAELIDPKTTKKPKSRSKPKAKNDNMITNEWRMKSQTAPRGRRFQICHFPSAELSPSSQENVRSSDLSKRPKN